MSKLLGGFVWAWKNYEGGKKSIQSVRKFYPDADIVIQVDKDGDIENYNVVGEELKCDVRHNLVQIGYCGNFGSVDVGRDCWPRELAFEWLGNLYKACINMDCKYIILLEEDDFVLTPLSILNDEFSMAIHPTDPSPTGRHRPNYIPPQFLDFSRSIGGVDTAPGYGAGGGVIFNRRDYVLAYEKAIRPLVMVYDKFVGINKIIGWEDFLLQYIMMLGGYEIIQNHRLCEHWEVGEHWRNFEIVTGLKDYTLVDL